MIFLVRSEEEIIQFHQMRMNKVEFYCVSYTKNESRPIHCLLARTNSGRLCEELKVSIRIKPTNK
jgi:hypothetical protein